VVVVVCTIAVLAATASANTPPSLAVIAALAPGPDHRDAREAVAVGPAGQAYEPDGKGAWIRHHAGGIAGEVVRAVRAGAMVIAGVQAGPPFGWHAGAWSAIQLGLKAQAQLGRGARVTAAVGKLVFTFDGGKPTKLPEAPGPVAAIGASGKGIVVETDHGLAKLAGARWKPIAGAPPHVAVLLDDKWAIVDRGLLALDSQKLTAWPAGFHVATAVAVTAELVVAAGIGPHGSSAELVTLRAGKLDREPIAFDHASPIVAVVADKSGRVVVATRDGQLAIRDRATWTTATVSDDLPAARPGSPPAVSK